MLSRFSLSIIMLFITAHVGLVIWIISDNYQHTELSKMFRENLNQQFSGQAREQRARFDHYVKSFHPGVKIFAATTGIKKYVKNIDWKKAPDLVKHTRPPSWLPGMSVMRRFIHPKFAMLIDKSGKVREVYHYKYSVPPNDLINISAHTLELSHGQSYLTLFDNRPYLLAAAYIGESNNNMHLLIASPIDEEFLMISQGESTYTSIIALLKGSDRKIFVSSNRDLIANGVSLESLSNDYLSMGEGFFDSGSSDILLHFISFISTKEIEKQTNSFLMKDRIISAMTALAFIAVFGAIMYLLTSRIQKLTRKVVQFSDEMDIAQPELMHNDPIKELESRFGLLATAVQHETAALEHQALHDPLTNIPNRKLLNDRIQREKLRCESENCSFIVMISDLDRFKEINDTLGHHIGDIILQQSCDRIQTSLRKNDTVARFGGDEFGILLTDISLEVAEKIAIKITDLFKQPFDIEDQNLSVGISIGVVEYPRHGNDVNILMQRADIAMYNAKSSKLGALVYKQSEDKYSVKRLELMSDLRKAIDDNLLNLYFQPKFDLKTGHIVSAEALLRWTHPVRGNIPPDDFIPLAEQTGLIQPLTEWVVDESLKQMKQWIKYDHNVSVAINISVYSLQSDKLLNILKDTLSKYKVPASKCILELTEGVFMQDQSRAKDILNELSKLGVQLSIDDFGTGYSSLTYLKQLPVSELKIDRSFIMDMIENENDAMIVKTIIELGHNLGLRVIAEGVENKETMDWLNVLGCDLVQGYYTGKPVPGHKFSEMLHNELSNIRLIAGTK
jgi:diguanylate cyclase (GGDEF)-like protein